MSMTELKVTFPTEKLEALRFFMGKKEQTIEKELQDYMDKIYEKMVPAQVREYLESRIEQTAAQSVAQEPEPASATRERTSRQTRRQREQAVLQPAAAPEGLVEPNDHSETEIQGMTMNM